jgi:hypothetical protein
MSGARGSPEKRPGCEPGQKSTLTPGAESTIDLKLARLVIRMAYAIARREETIDGPRIFREALALEKELDEAEERAAKAG